MTDRIADMLTRIRNANRMKYDTVEVLGSKMTTEIARILKEEGYINDYKVNEASNGNTKSTKTILKHPEKYHVSKAIKLGDYNIGRSESGASILTIPFYLAFLLKEY